MLGYNVLAFIGCLASIAILTSQLRQQKLAAVHGVMIPLLVFVASRFSARFLYGIESGRWHETVSYYFSFGPGHTSQFAGLYPSLAIVFMYALAIRVPFLRLLDLVVPAACAAIAFGRIGCLIAGCCPGFLLPEGWSLPAWIPNSHHFPASLAEGLAAALLALFLLAVPATALSPGERTGWFFLLLGSVPLPVHPRRGGHHFMGSPHLHTSSRHTVNSRRSFSSRSIEGDSVSRSSALRRLCVCPGARMSRRRFLEGRKNRRVHEVPNNAANHHRSPRCHRDHLHF